MTLDERIQALTESVKSLASMHRDAEKRPTESGERLAAAVADIKDLMNRMGRILEHRDISIDDHEDRIDCLQGGEK